MQYNKILQIITNCNVILTAIKLLQEGESIDYVMEVTGLSKEEIVKLKYQN